MNATHLRIDRGSNSPYALDISYHDVPMRGLPDALEGMVCVQITDLHAGMGNIEPVHAEIVRRVQEIKPDLLLFTGDYIDRHAPDNRLKSLPVQEVMASLEAPLGKFGVFGNHDHTRGVVGAKRILEAAGVVPLWNENRQLPQGIWLAGIDDVRTGTPRIQEALAGIPENVTPLVLSHNPSIFDFTPRREMVLFAGHTHGGQIVPPLLSPKIICRLRLQCRYVAGWYRKGVARLYVSRGIGMTGKPFRYRCPAEIAVFRLINTEDTPRI